MPLQSGDRKDAVHWFTEPSWIVFSYTDDGFCTYFEESYFKPGTPKNAEQIVPRIRETVKLFHVEQDQALLVQG